MNNQQKKRLNEITALFDKYKPIDKPMSEAEKRQVKKVAMLLLKLANTCKTELPPIYLEYLSNLITNVPMEDIPIDMRFALWAGLMNKAVNHL